jgi:hypothetical protein
MHYLSAQATFNVLLTSLDALMRGARRHKSLELSWTRTELTRQAGFQKILSKAPVTPALFFCPIVSAGVDGAQHAFCSRYTTGLISYEYRSIRSAVWCE